MIVLGLLVLLLVVAVSIVAIARGGDPVTFEVGSLSFDTDGAGMFLAGAGSLLLAVVGFWLLSKGMVRSRHRRQEMRELRNKAARSDAETRPDHASGTEARDPARPAGTTGTETRTDTTRTDTTRVDSGRHTDTDEHFDSAPRDR